MNSANPLDQLPPLALPEAVSWWPLAPLWWLVILALLAALTWLLHKVYKHHANNRLRNLAKRELAAIYTHYQFEQDTQHYLLQSNALIKRFVLQQYPGYAFAKLSQREWLEQLDRFVGKPLLCCELGEHLINIYQKPEQNLNIPALHQLLVSWLDAFNVNITKPPITQSPNVYGANKA